MQKIIDPELAYRQFDTLYVETQRHTAINAALEESLNMMRRSAGSPYQYHPTRMNRLEAMSSAWGKKM